MKIDARHPGIPVQIAKDISETFNKGVVVIVAYDTVDNFIHTATYGNKLPEKHVAAYFGQVFTQIMGGDLSQKRSFEDFRDRVEGSYEQER